MSKEQIAQAAAEAIRIARSIHQKWHWDTKQTNCPWGCGDGSGIIAK